ncbi:MAG: DUF2214 family protein [Flavobacteriales bacterium]|nr:DUF2214 family protein [Flavobacteriales bacterium]
MELRYALAVLHLLPLAIGIAAVYARGRALRCTMSTKDLAAVFHADNWYGVAALLWLTTGLWRAFGGLEKGTSYYLESPLFLLKMGLFAVVFLLELWPMITLVRWRLALRKGRSPGLDQANLLAHLSMAQVPLLLLMVAFAAAMARGM